MSSDPLVPWTEELKAATFKDLGQTEAEIKESIVYIREWMKKQPHLPEIMPDPRIERFLLMNKGSREKTKSKIDMYYSLKTQVPEIFLNRLPNSKRIINIMKVACNIPSPLVTDDNKRVVCFRLFDTDPNKFQPMDLFAFTFLIAEVRTWIDYCTGDIAVFDLTGITWEHLIKYTPLYIKKIISIVETFMSTRMSGIHFVNGSQYLETFLSVLKTVLPQKFKERLYVHNDYEALHKVIPKRILPKDFDGDSTPLKELTEQWHKKLLEYTEFFEKQETMYSNEKLRPGSPIKHLFSDMEIQGSFRKLNID